MAKVYKTLITGRNTAIIDDFFNHLSDNFDILSTSLRFDDMDNHIEKFKPEIFVICLNGETRDDMSKISELKRRLTREEVVVFIVGSPEDCDNFQKSAVYMADGAFEKPKSILEVKNGIIDFMEAKAKKEAEEVALQQKLEEVKEQERRKHVLVIDDDPIMLKLIKEHLHENYDVATAISGKIAYKFLESKKTDLILLDYEMPVENGPTVLTNLRENNLIEGVPVLFLTGVSDKEKIREALSLKPQGYLLKPIDKDKLIGTVEKYIG